MTYMVFTYYDTLTDSKKPPGNNPRWESFNDLSLISLVQLLIAAPDLLNIHARTFYNNLQFQCDKKTKINRCSIMTCPFFMITIGFDIQNQNGFCMRRLISVVLLKLQPIANFYFQIPILDDFITQIYAT